jgi:Mn2+/Fe2+ NRAMP family transporter
MAKNSILKKIVIALSAIGPGIFMIGYNIGTGSITTLISAGSTYQMHLLWVLLIACFVTYVMLIAYQQFTLVTGVTSMRAYRRHLPLGKLIAIFIIASMSLGEFVGIAGITGIVSKKALEESIKEVVKKKFVELNLKALAKGFELAEEYKKK